MERLGWVSSPRLLAPLLRSGSTLETHALAFRCRSLGTELRTPKVWMAGRGKRAVAFPSNFSLIATKPDVTTPSLPRLCSHLPHSHSLGFLFPLLHSHPRRCTRLSASSPAFAAKGFHPRRSEIYIVTAPLRDHWCSRSPSRPMIGGPLQVICMPAAAGSPAVQAAAAAEKFAQRFLAGWSGTRSARGAASFCRRRRRRPVLSGFLVCGGQTLCLREFEVDKGE